MISGTDIDSSVPGVVAAAPARGSAVRAAVVGSSSRRAAAGIFASFAVVGLAAAVVAPTGLALADPAHAAQAQTAFSLATEQTQDLTVTTAGATIAPQARGVFEVYVPPPPAPEPEPAAVAAASPTTGSGSSGPLFYSGGGAPAEWMAAAGIAASDWGFVDYIVSKESGWNPNATNSSSGACGLVQAYPCSKVPGSGYDPVDNLRWANGYATGRYGSWSAAHSFWTSNHWW